MGTSAEFAQRNPGLDAVRVVATFAVVVYHASYETYVGLTATTGLPSVLMPVLNRLNVGVPIFFCLSGFLVGGPFIRRFIVGEPRPPVGGFLLQRSARVLPAYWFALAVLVPLGATLPVNGTSGYLRSISLVHTFSSDHAFSGLAQAWTLSVEMSFYFSLPLLFAVLAVLSRALGVEGRTRLLIVALVVLVVFAYGFQFFWWNHRTGILATASIWLPSHVDALAMGMLLAVLAERRGHSPRAGRISEWLVRWSGPILATSAIIWFASSRIGYPIGLTGVLTFRTQILGHALFTLSSFLFLIPFCLSPRGSRLMRWSSVRPIAWLASISYGIYLWHVSFLMVGRTPSLLPFVAGDGKLFARLAVIVPGSIAVAAFSYRFIERPLIGLARRRSGGRVSADAQLPNTATSPTATV